LSICPFAYLRNHTAKLHQRFCARCLLSWLGPLTALRHVIYFRFCGCRHVFTHWAPWYIMCIPKRRQTETNTLIDSSQMLLNDKDQQVGYISLTVDRGWGKSAIYNCLDWVSTNCLARAYRLSVILHVS